MIVCLSFVVAFSGSFGFSTQDVGYAVFNSAFFRDNWSLSFSGIRTNTDAFGMWIPQSWRLVFAMFDIRCEMPNCTQVRGYVYQNISEDVTFSQLQYILKNTCITFFQCFLSEKILHPCEITSNSTLTPHHSWYIGSNFRIPVRDVNTLDRASMNMSLHSWYDVVFIWLVFQRAQRIWNERSLS